MSNALAMMRVSYDEANKDQTSQISQPIRDLLTQMFGNVIAGKLAISSMCFPSTQLEGY